MHAKRTRMIPLLVATLMGWLGLLAVVFASDPAAFSHKVHVTDQQLECTDCHDVESPTGPALPLEGCTNCHDESIGSYTKKVPEKTTEFVFDHPRHHAAGTPCLSCHTAEFKTEADLPGTPARNYEACADCHRTKLSPPKNLSCVACHEKDLKKERPADHNGAWSSRHGDEATWRNSETHGKDCTFCHGRNGCKSCHRSQMPRSHTAVWRKVAHGAAAGWDRSSCRTCHETGTCIRCHRNSKPRSHVPSWQVTHKLQATLDRQRCNICHTQSYCARCHHDKNP